MSCLRAKNSILWWRQGLSWMKNRKDSWIQLSLIHALHKACTLLFHTCETVNNSCCLNQQLDQRQKSLKWALLIVLYMPCIRHVRTSLKIRSSFQLDKMSCPIKRQDFLSLGWEMCTSRRLVKILVRRSFYTGSNQFFVIWATDTDVYLLWLHYS